MISYFVSFQYPVVGSSSGGGGAVSCNHSRMTASSECRREAFMMACARVNAGVYGFSASNDAALGNEGGVVFRSLVCDSCQETFTRKAML